MGCGGGYRRETAASAKGPPVCAGLSTPSAGPRSIPTQSNKAFPLSSPQNTKQSGEGEGARDEVVGREGSCSASHTNFLNPPFHLLLLFLSPFPTLTTNHLTLHRPFASPYPPPSISASFSSSASFSPFSRRE